MDYIHLNYNKIDIIDIESIIIFSSYIYDGRIIFLLKNGNVMYYKSDGNVYNIYLVYKYV